MQDETRLLIQRSCRKVVIEEGKCLIDVSDEIWEIWREYERRGNDDDEMGK